MKGGGWVLGVFPGVKIASVPISAVAVPITAAKLLNTDKHTRVQPCGRNSEFFMQCL